MRFVVTELEGYAIIDGGSTGRVPGVSFQVIDTLVNRRLLAIYRSEDHLRRGGTLGGSHPHEEQVRRAREAAHTHADRLNEEYAAA